MGQVRQSRKIDSRMPDDPPRCIDRTQFIVSISIGINGHIVSKAGHVKAKVEGALTVSWIASIAIAEVAGSSRVAAEEISLQVSQRHGMSLSKEDGPTREAHLKETAQIEVDLQAIEVRPRRIMVA